MTFPFCTTLIKWTTEDKPITNAQNHTSGSLSDASDIDSGLLFGYGFLRGGLSFLAIFLLVLEATGDGRFGQGSFNESNRLFLAWSVGSSPEK